ncbi:13913_t:CDS:2, partial [Gigaspora margarita]
RYVEILEPNDLMQEHWDLDCFRPQTQDGYARIIQTAWRNYKQRPESLAIQVWNSLKTDNYPNDKKFLGITPQKVNRSDGYSYIDYNGKQLFWHSKSSKLWAESKKSLLTYRLYDYVVNLLQQNGYRLIGGRSWYVMLQWVENPEQYLNNGCQDFNSTDFFLRYIQMKFNQAYTGLVQQLPPSLVEDTWKRLTMRKRNPLTELEARGINPEIEDFLQHEIIVYTRKKQRQRRSIPLLENLLYDIDMANQETQIQNTAPICICDQTHKCPCFASEDEINRQRLMEYNENTFGKFMREITNEHEERVKANKKLRCEVEEKKIELREAEKILASLKSHSTH